MKCWPGQDGGAGVEGGSPEEVTAEISGQDGDTRDRRDTMWGRVQAQADKPGVRGQAARSGRRATQGPGGASHF